MELKSAVENLLSPGTGSLELVIVDNCVEKFNSIRRTLPWAYPSFPPIYL